MAWAPMYLLLATTCAAIWAGLLPCDASVSSEPFEAALLDLATRQRDQQSALDSLRAHVDALRAQLDTLQHTAFAAPPPTPPTKRCFASPPAPEKSSEPFPDPGSFEDIHYDEGELPLHAAAAHDDVPALLAHLRRGARLDERDARGNTALHAAAREDAAKATQVLLKHGADFRTRGELLRTPLHAAAAHGQVETARLLAEAGAAPGARDAHGATALTLAGAAGRAALAEWLLARAPAAEWVDAAGDGALLAAARAGRWARAERLAGGGAAPAARGPDGASALLLAARAAGPRPLAALEAMLRGGALCDARELARALAAANGAPQVWAIAQAAPEEVAGDAGHEALLQAARDGRASALAALMAAGVEPMYTDADGRTALQLAAREGHVACVEILLPVFVQYAEEFLQALNVTNDAQVVLAFEAAAPLVVRGPIGMELLRYAARDGRCEFVTTLLPLEIENEVLEEILRPNAETEYSKCLTQILKKLLSSENQTAKVERLINISRSAGILEMAAKTVPYVFLTVVGEKTFVRAVEENKCYLIRPLIAAGSDPKGRNAQDALSLAVTRASVDCVRALREAGVPSLSGRLWDVTLRNASRTCRAELLSALLAAGVDPTLPDADGRTALQLAAREGHAPCVKTLLPRFADRSDLVLSALNDTRSAPVASALAAAVLHLLQGATGEDLMLRAVREGLCDLGEVLLSVRSRQYVDAAMVLCQPFADVKCVAPILDGLKSIEEEIKAVRLIMERTDRIDIVQAAMLLPNVYHAVAGKTALTDAVTERKCYLIGTIFRAGVGPGSEDAHRALEAAAEKAIVECVNALRMEGVAPLADERWKRALRDAGAAGQREAMQALLAAGVFVDAADDLGHTALTLAASNGHADCVVDLLNAGADKDRTELDGNTALMLASREGHLDVVLKLLHAHAQVDAKSESQNTALMLASLKGHVEVVRILLKAGAKLDEGNMVGDTPLILACWKGHEEVVRELLGANANVDVKNERNDTALIVASHFGYMNIVSQLLNANAQVNISNNHGGTALTNAAGIGYLEITRLLLNAHADVNAKTKEGFTALMNACSGGNLQIVNLLLENNADIAVKNNYGNTAIDVAADKEHTEIVKILKKRS